MRNSALAGEGEECARVMAGAEEKAAPLERDRKWEREYGDLFRGVLEVDEGASSGRSLSRRRGRTRLCCLSTDSS